MVPLGRDLRLTRSAADLRLHGHASLPASLGQTLNFSAAADGPVEQYATLASTFSFDGDRLDLAGWADLLPDEWPAPETGQGSFRITGALRGPALMQLSAQVETEQCRVGDPDLVNRVARCGTDATAARRVRFRRHREQLEADEASETAPRDLSPALSQW